MGYISRMYLHGWFISSTSHYLQSREFLSRLGPSNAPKDWGYSNNSQGWMSNIHGAESLRQRFEPLTWEKANGEWHLLLFDGHDSHISGDWFPHCLDNKIIPALLVPHSSHLTQPLDIGVFSPLK